MMIDIESVFQNFDKYLTGGQIFIGAAAELVEPAVQEEQEPQTEAFGPNDDIGEIAYQHARRLNGVEVDRTVRESETDEMRDK